MNKQDIQKLMEAYESVVSEKTLTPAEKKKREEIAKAMEKDNPDMPMAKKMAIATATAKRVAEEVELEEASGKDIAAKMMKSKSMKAFAPKVAKMANVSAGDLEKMLPDYVPGAEIRKLFEESLDEKVNTSEEEAIQIIANSIAMKDSVVKAALKAANLNPIGVVTALKGKKTIKAMQLGNLVMDHAFSGSISKRDLAPIAKAASAAFKASPENMKKESVNEELWKEIETYAKKHGGIDKNDMMKVAMMLKKGDRKGAVKYARGLDTDPRDWLLDKMNEELQEQSCGKDRMKKEAEEKDDDKKIDPVNKKALKKDFDDRDDKDIDNDGDVDDSDEYLHKRRKAVGKAMAKDKKDGKTAEISKIGEAFDEFWSALQEAANPKKGATPPEGLTDKESPKSKEFIAKHTVDVEDEEKTHQTATDAGRATKPAPARPGDNKAGDKNIVNPVKGAVKEDTRTYQQKIMDILSGKTWGEIADNVEELKGEE